MSNYVYQISILRRRELGRITNGGMDDPQLLKRTFQLSFLPKTNTFSVQRRYIFELEQVFFQRYLWTYFARFSIQIRSRRWITPNLTTDRQNFGRSIRIILCGWLSALLFVPVWSGMGLEWGWMDLMTRIKVGSMNNGREHPTGQTLLIEYSYADRTGQVVITLDHKKEYRIVFKFGMF